MVLGAKSGRVALAATVLEGGPDFGLSRTTPSLRPLEPSRPPQLRGPGWRLDPTSPHRIPEAATGVQVSVLCRQGYSSSLAAASLRALGVDATDVIGGVEAWAAAGLPLTDGPADVRE
ncbi:hypothetical protein O9K63_11210 [Janibacter cremeus]|uniref:rhodanese-like domain-containing protein n=1 Tax=Janibacter cremeus TaxID=1285192 RepID=UPI0023F95A30|nr:hypothetical protein [Janibacter cremeus]WEV77161.1 hypothetical protein O9K63_11210 [Janibacter cremeus]